MSSGIHLRPKQKSQQEHLKHCVEIHVSHLAKLKMKSRQQYRCRDFILFISVGFPLD